VAVPEALLKERCQDRSNGNWFFLPDGTRDPFWEALRERCGKYVKEHKVPRTIGWGTLAFSVFLLLAQWPMWYFGYLNLYPWTSHATAIVMAVTTWIAGRLGHDGSHFAISKNSYWSQVFGNWGGIGLSNIAYWELLHTIQHHSDTNIKDLDPDLYHYVVFLRDHPDYPWTFFHRLQFHRVWCYIVWSFTVAGLLILEPMNYLLFGHGTFPSVGPYVRQRPWFWIKLVFHMIWFPVFFIGIPLYVAWDSNPNKFIVVGVRFASFFAYLAVAGLCFGLFSQINHFSENCVAAANKNTSWAVRQVETAANFATDSKFWDMMTGGINIQIEHHLFPGMAEDQLHGLLPIVKETCKEFGVEYKDFPTFWSILSSTHRYIDTLAMPNRVSPRRAVA
jgi:linoleoyl-CoA desaturase